MASYWQEENIDKGLALNKYILKINIPKGDLRKGLGKWSTHHRNLKMTISLFSGRGWNTLRTFPDISTQWNARVRGAETSKGCKNKWPIITYYTESQAMFSISRCSGVFFWALLSGKKWLRTPPSHFLFLGKISLHTTAVSAFFLCWGGSDMVPGVPTTSSIGDSRAFALCDHERTWRLVQFWQAADFFFPRMTDVWGISVLQLSFPH